VRGSGVVSAVLAKVGYAAACFPAVVGIVVAGYAHSLVGLTKQIEGGASIGDSSSVGAMNILLMGLESRTDFDGNTLSSAQLTTTHSGSDEPGGNLGAQDTDTLILIHVFAGGQKAIGYSIPPDDVVNYPHTSDGGTEGKIDGAQSVSSVLFGARPQAPARPATKPTATASASSTSSASDNQAVSANAPYGIPCVY
jgi:anionic cell wall polymer biosynthesis LytR-Cps2A-Psr (LCP) family protein